MAADSHAERSEQVRAALVRTLLDKVEEDTYPSTTMLNLIEELLHDEELPEYVDFLRQRIEADRFPSIPLMSRLVEIAKPA